MNFKSSGILIFIAVFLFSSTCIHASSMKKDERARIINSIEIEGSQNIIKAFIDPTKIIIEPLISKVEKKNNIKIEGSEILGSVTKDAINQLLQSSEHLIKIATGSKIIKTKIKIESNSITYSIWSKWEKRKLQAPVISLSVFYDNAKPTMKTLTGI